MENQKKIPGWKSFSHGIYGIHGIRIVSAVLNRLPTMTRTDAAVCDTTTTTTITAGIPRRGVLRAMASREEDLSGT
jgi:hypothetical protein